jgi:flagellar assembly protein FliH
MSTSTSLAPAPQASQASPFLYQEAPTGDVSPGTPSRGLLESTEEAARREAAAREVGRQEGQNNARETFEKELIRARDAISQTLQAFAREREAFYQRVEGEVVNLALAIARKILHREAQLDPMLLAGMVRVALEKIEAGTEVVVRVCPERAANWRDYFTRTIDPQDVPEVVEDPTLEADACVIQTQIGKTELGVAPQLKEIEQGLLDLLAQRPQGAR